MSVMIYITDNSFYGKLNGIDVVPLLKNNVINGLSFGLGGVSQSHNYVSYSYITIDPSLKDGYFNNCVDCYQSMNIENSSNCFECYNCSNINSCFQSENIQNCSFVWKNVQLTEAEYFNKLNKMFLLL